MTKPTGRPVGRPKTKDYKTMLARIPQDLHDQVLRYAARHRQSVSELIRDGLQWRITEGDPLGYGQPRDSRAEGDSIPTLQADALLPDMLLDEDEQAVPPECNTVIHRSIDVLHDGPHVEQPRVAQSRPAHQRTPSMLAEVESLEDMPLYPNVDPDQAVAEGQPPGATPDNPDFDPKTYTLGTLCSKGHVYGTTGKSLRRVKDNECKECQRVRQAASRQRKRQQVAPLT